MVALIHGSLISAIFTGIRHVGRVVQFDLGLVGERDLVDDRGGCGDEVEVELALEPLLDDLEVQEPEEAAAEAEAERGRSLHLVGEARIVEAEPAHRRAQGLEVGRVGREEAAEDDRLGRLEAGQRLSRWAAVVGDRVADAGVGHLLDLGGEVADLAAKSSRPPTKPTTSISTPSTSHSFAARAISAKPSAASPKAQP